MAAATQATAALDRLGLHFRRHEYDVGGGGTHGFGDHAVAALGVDPDRFFKTLIVAIDVGSGRPSLACAVVPVALRLDLRAFAAACGHRRAVLADPAAAERSTGSVRGGISPIGQRTALACLVDETAALWETVLVSGGRRGLALELAPADLLTATRARYADITTNSD